MALCAVYGQVAPYACVWLCCDSVSLVPVQVCGCVYVCMPPKCMCVRVRVTRHLCGPDAMYFGEKPHSC